MLRTKISSKGQVVVPKEIRSDLKIEPGTFLHVRAEKRILFLLL